MAAGDFLMLLRRAQPPQASAFHPVSLAGLSRSFGGDLKPMTPRLFHRSYATQFARANAALVGGGFLELIRRR